jgi:hypothetical protein
MLSLVRIAGLPASVLEPFGGEALPLALRALDAAEAELSTVRGGVGDFLHDILKELPAELRGLALEIRRDCFNERSVTRLRTLPGWEELRGRTGRRLDLLLELEERERRAAAELERVFAGEAERELGWLRTVVADPGFRRGLALASPLVAAGRSRSGDRRRERRMTASLLRYVSRAAFKLSPYSTFTRVALARIVDGPLRLCGGPAEWEERSLVRLRLYLAEQIAAVLRRAPGVWESQRVRLNPTLEEAGPGRCRLLRPGFWSIEKGAMRQRAPAVLETSLDDSLLDWLRERLRGEPSLGNLAAAMDEDFGSSEALEKLLQMGLLLADPPWPTDHPRLEEAAGLVRLVEREDAFSSASDPEVAVREIGKGVMEVWRSGLAAAGLPAETALYQGKEGEVYEDVMVLGPGGEADPVLVEAPLATMREAVRCASPWLRLIDLQSPRYEILYTLAATLRSRWPGRETVGVLELFQEVRLLWRQLERGLSETFDPFGLPEIAELARLRRQVREKLPGLVREGEDGGRIDPADLETLLAPLPSFITPVVGPSLFLQPADPEGRLWVLNRIFEGTGRYASRFTAVMPDEARRRFSEDMAARAPRFLDLAWPHGDTLNVHGVQTPRVLVLPGEIPELPAGVRMELQDLRIRLDPASGLPGLTDAEGQPVVPVWLGAAALTFAPSLIRFLAAFGPGELKPVSTPRPARPLGDVKVLDRLLLGPLVLGRRRWILPTEALRERIDERLPARAWAEVDRWRRSLGVPDRVFALEKIRHETIEDLWKPQYLDLTSPLFFQILEAVARTVGPSLVLEEMLPAPEAFPRDAAGEHWAVELQLEGRMEER